MARGSKTRESAAFHLQMIRELTRKGDCGRASYWFRKLDEKRFHKTVRPRTMATAYRLIDRCYVKGRGGHV